MNKKPEPKPLSLEWWIAVRREYKKEGTTYLCASYTFAGAWGIESVQKKIKSIAKKLMPLERKQSQYQDELFLPYGNASRLKFLNLVIKQLKSEKK